MKSISDSEHSANIPEPQAVIANQPSTLYLIVSQMPAAILFTAITGLIWVTLENGVHIGEWLCPGYSNWGSIFWTSKCTSNPLFIDPRIFFSVYTALGVASGLWILNRMIRVRGNWVLSLAVIFVISYFEEPISQAAINMKLLEPLTLFIVVFGGAIFIGLLAPFAFHSIRVFTNMLPKQEVQSTTDPQGIPPTSVRESKSSQIWQIFSKEFMQIVCTCGAIYVGFSIVIGLFFSFANLSSSICGFFKPIGLGSISCQNEGEYSIPIYLFVFVLALFAAIGCIYTGAVLRLRGTKLGAVLHSAVVVVLLFLLSPWISTLNTSRFPLFVVKNFAYFLLLASAAFVTLGYHLNHLFKKRVIQEPPTPM
jgi:hypothetical protein